MEKKNGGKINNEWYEVYRMQSGNKGRWWIVEVCITTSGKAKQDHTTHSRQAGRQGSREAGRQAWV